MTAPVRPNAEVIRNVQVILKRSTPALRTDGYWGSYTNSAYTSAPVSERMRVDAVLAAHGLTVKQLYDETRKLKRARDLNWIASRAQARAERGQVDTNAKEVASALGRDHWVSKDEMVDIIRRVSGITGVAESTLHKFLDLETGPVKRNGILMYDASVRNSLGYRGLFQFDGKGAAWAGASKIIALPPFDSSWANPFYNTLAAAAYVLANTKIIRRLGYTGIITGNIAYLMHNQGAGGAVKILKGEGAVAGKQSQLAMTVIADARREAVSQRAIA